ncbi:MAG: glycosyltransferase family 2 protein [Simkaniaceae bacterium]|nr:glycosyltransferase family 2 protein [Simkaniaceae bacterium]
MKKLFLFSLLVLGLGFGYYKLKPKISKYNLKRKLNIAKPSDRVLTDSSFVFIIPSYNNADLCRKNLSSVFDQKYSNYRIIYIDDASQDGTFEAAKDVVAEYGMQGYIELIRNEENQGALANLYKHIHRLNADEIVVILDGDDWLAHPNVLSELNSYYARSRVWMTYGQYLQAPTYEKGLCAPLSQYTLKRAKCRNEHPWVTSHLRTFYAGLFRYIKKEDLMYEGKFFPTTYDLAIMLPMIEMAREHCFFTPNVSYIYNFGTPSNDGKIHREEQIFFEKYIRNLPIYPRLKKNPREEHND